MKRRFLPALCLPLALLAACGPPGGEALEPGTVSRPPAAEGQFWETSPETLLASEIGRASWRERVLIQV